MKDWTIMPFMKPDECTAEQLAAHLADGWATTHSMMNPQAGRVWIRAEDKGVPHLDPACETYWSS